MNTEDKLVMLVRLSSIEGYASFADVLDVVHKLQAKGVQAICEQSPGALMDSQDTYVIKVPVSQFEDAKTAFQEIVSN